MQITAAYYKGGKTFSVERKDSVPPGPDDVEIDISYCGICGTDLHVYLGHMDQRIGHHRVIGHEMSGVVSAVGQNVSGIAAGRNVVVRPLDHCGDCPACRRGHRHICQNLKFLGLDTDGAFQEKWTVPAHTVHTLPDGIDLRQLDREIHALARELADGQLRANRAGELVAEELRLAQSALSEITGEFASDDLLGRIFSEFCIGK